MPPTGGAALPAAGLQASVYCRCFNNGLRLVSGSSPSVSGVWRGAGSRQVWPVGWPGRIRWCRLPPTV